MHAAAMSAAAAGNAAAAAVDASAERHDDADGAAEGSHAGFKFPPKEELKGACTHIHVLYVVNNGCDMGSNGRTLVPFTARWMVGGWWLVV